MQLSTIAQLLKRRIFQDFRHLTKYQKYRCQKVGCSLSESTSFENHLSSLAYFK